MRRRLILLLIGAALIGGLFVGQASAEPLYSQEVTGPSLDELAVKGILADHGSPLPWWTICAFKDTHPAFDIAGYLAVMWAESSLGKTCDYKNNPGSIKGGSVGTVWRDLRIGVSPAGYNVYRSIYDGQRAAIRLIYDCGYNADLAAEDWWGFANRYYGRGVPGISRYVANLEAAHTMIVKEAREYGTLW
jgi:hypothetical protein